MFKSIVVVDPCLSGKGQSLLGKGFTVGQGECIFTIGCLFESCDASLGLSYLEFRTELFKSNLNSELRKLGYKIDLHKSTGNVDTSSYKLVRQVRSI